MAAACSSAPPPMEQRRRQTTGAGTATAGEGGQGRAGGHHRWTDGAGGDGGVATGTTARGGDGGAGGKYGSPQPAVTVAAGGNAFGDRLFPGPAAGGTGSFGTNGTNGQNVDEFRSCRKRHGHLWSRAPGKTTDLDGLPLEGSTARRDQLPRLAFDERSRKVNAVLPWQAKD